jgi:hypothetical protein
MRNLLLIFVVLFTGTLHSLATVETVDHNLLWQKGNEFYEQKQYDSAAYYFEQIAATKPQNADLYYNLGNTYYRLNKIALAVLNYERALQINPEHKEAKDNLTLAQSRISNHIQPANDIFFIKWWQTLTQPKSATAWAMWALAVFCLIIVLMLLRRFQKPGGIHLPIQLQGILVFVFVCLLIFSFTSANRNTQNASGVVMEADTPLMNNDQKGKPLALIPEGTVVKIVSEKSGWAEVRLPDGRTGWLQESLLSKI